MHISIPKLLHLKAILTVLILLVLYEILRIIIIENQSKSMLKDSIILKPFCQCSNSSREHILVDKYILLDIISVNLIRETNSSIESKKHLYSLITKELRGYKRTCDLYNVLKRGKHQKVIAYSLYGSNPKYSQNLEDIAKQIRLKYPNFVSRVYYDSSVPKETRCRLECQYGDVMDFCNIDQFTIDFDLDKEVDNKVIDMSYLHKSMWRFLAIGDSFVDVFMSRDTDSFFTNREIDSVNVWLNSSTIGHIMRDHQYHNIEILAGMWGVRTEVDRKIAQRIFSMLMNKPLCERYNRNKRGPKQGDQYFLRENVYKLLVNNSTIHDSYFCRRYSNSKPFPTQRKEMDHVGSVKSLLNATKKISICPVVCRPPEHQDWLYC